MGELTAPEYIRELVAYEPGKPIEEVQRELGLNEVIKLASNENPLGSSPKALAAVRAALPGLNRYPDGGGYRLRQALAALHGVDMSQVVLGSGSCEIIDMVARAYLADEDAAVISCQSFPMYYLSVRQVNGLPILVPVAPGRRHDLAAMAQAAAGRAKVVFIANPNNPTGTYSTRDELDRLLARVGDDVLVVLDQAYHEYVDRPDFPDGLDDLKKGHNVIVLRTFSKIYGLAGLRIGYALSSPQVIADLNRVRPPFNTTSLAQAAALAALEDADWAQRSREHNLTEAAFVQQELEKRGVSYVPSVTNFVLVELELNARQVFQELQGLGVIVRPFRSAELANCARVSVGTRAENERFLWALDELVARRP